MAARPVGVWGIDLGQCALKAIRLEMQDGNIVATAFEYIEHPKILSQPDADPDELTRQALGQFLERNQIKGDLICIGVAGQAGLARFVKLPPVDEKKIADIVKFEAKQQIPFPLEEVVWDYQRLSRGEIVEGMALETEIGLFAMKRDMVLRAIRQFKEVDVEVHVVQMAPLALCNFVAYDLLGKDVDAEEDGSKSCIVCLEIGTDNSNLVITDGGRIIWQRPIPIGGNHFTRALTKELKLTFAKAEHLKRNAAKSPELKKILGSLKQVLNDFVGEVQRSLGYFTNTHRNAEIQYMVGLGNAFRLPGLQKYLQEKLQLEVRKLQKMERATGDAVTTAPQFSDNIMSFGVAYGLALQGLKQARLQTNLLPYEVRLERVIRGKKPWMVAAAASLLFGMCLIAMASGMEKNALEDKAIEAEGKKLEQVAKTAKDNEAEFNNHNEKLKKSEETLRRIGAGVDERMNWQLLHQYVNLCTPQPNGKRLVDRAENRVEALKVFWQNNKKAQKAWQDYQDRQTGKYKDLPTDKAMEMDKFIKENLIQVNVIGINAMFTEDLGPFYKKIIADGAELIGMHQYEKDKVKAAADKDEAARKADSDQDAGKSVAEAKNAPKDGWVVEIRGYTFFKQGPEEFVEATLLENLKYPSKVKDIAMTEALKNKIEKRVGYLHLYKRKTVPVPVPGRFEVVSKSYLPSLLKGDAAAGGLGGPAGPGGMPGMPGAANPRGGEMPGGMPGAGAGGGGGGGDKEKPNRDLWRPIGTEAASVIGEGGGGGGMGFPGGAMPGFPGGAEKPGPVMPQPFPGGGEVGKTKFEPKVVPRYEFVIVFIWRESIGPEPTAIVADTEKKN
jgi:type IV pilus assembly protein PilM